MLHLSASEWVGKKKTGLMKRNELFGSETTTLGTGSRKGAGECSCDEE